MVEAAQKHYGRVDILVNNAGVGHLPQPNVKYFPVALDVPSPILSYPSALEIWVTREETNMITLEHEMRYREKIEGLLGAVNS